MTEVEIENLILSELNIATPEAGGVLTYGGVPEWTSASHMNVIIALEEALGIEFTPDEIVEMTDVAAIQEVIRKRQEN